MNSDAPEREIIPVPTDWLLHRFEKRYFLKIRNMIEPKVVQQNI